MIKRHLIVMEFYVYDLPDEEVVKRVEKMAAITRAHQDNGCTITAVYNAPFGQAPVLIKGTETEKV